MVSLSFGKRLFRRKKKVKITVIDSSEELPPQKARVATLSIPNLRQPPWIATIDSSEELPLPAPPKTDLATSSSSTPNLHSSQITPWIGTIDPTEDLTPPPILPTTGYATLSTPDLRSGQTTCVDSETDSEIGQIAAASNATLPLPLPEPSPATPLNDWRKKTITLILVGETGVGKTSLLSLLANICACRKLDDFQLEHDGRNESNLSRDQSQTNKAISYTFHHANGRVLRVVDTPGLGDTRGVDQDVQHTESIIKALQGAIETLDGVLFMANGTLERAGPGIEYTMHMLSAIFPRSMAKNIGLLFTNVPDALSFNFNSNSLPAYIAKSELWTIQNPLAQLVRFREMDASTQSEKQILTFRRLLETSYASTIDTLNDIFGWLDGVPVQKTQPILGLYAKSQSLQVAVQNVISQGTVRDRVQARITRLQTELIALNQMIDANRENTTTLNRTVWEQTSTYGINVLCTKDGCYQNCQTACSGTFSLNPDEIRSTSSAFGWGSRYYCQVCYHHYSDHRHFRAKWEQKTTTQYVADHAAQQRLQAAQAQAFKNAAEQALIQNDLQQSELELRRLELQLRRSCVDFRGLSIARSFSDHLTSTVRLLEVRLSTMRSGRADAASSKQMEVRVETEKKKLAIVKAAEAIRK